MASEGNLSLGEFLRQERERRGITIEQVASATKINVRMLHSLEEDHYAELPAKPFVRGFVTSYARFIGIDPQELLTRFGDFIDQKAHDRPNREGGHSGYAFEKRDGDQSRKWLSVVMGIFVVGGGIGFVLIKPSLHHHHGTHIEKLREAHNAAPSPGASEAPVSLAAAGPVASPSPMRVAADSATGAAVPSPSPSPVAVAAAAPAAPSPAPSAQGAPAVAVAALPSPPAAVPSEAAPAPVVAAPVPTATAEPVEEASEDDPLASGINLKPAEIKHKIIFKALASVWVRYKVDNRPMMKFILRKDKILVLRARDSVRFQVSNSKGVTFNYNNHGAKLLKEAKNVATQQDTPTIYFPPEAGENISEPFPGEKPLTKTPVPPPPAPTPSATPAAE